jgi:NADH-quinone oxidoreductase subunit J
MIESFLFWAFALLAIPAALGVVFARNLVYSAVCLLVVFLAIAGLFMLNAADFLAVAQVMVYAVGLTIVLLFGLMFTGDKAPPLLRGKTGTLTLSLLAGLLGAVFLVRFMAKLGPGLQQKALPTDEPITSTVAALGSMLFNTYLLPFEVVSILLLAAMVGAIVLSKKHLEARPLVEGGLVFETNAKRHTQAHTLADAEMTRTQVDTQLAAALPAPSTVPELEEKPSLAPVGGPV